MSHHNEPEAPAVPKDLAKLKALDEAMENVRYLCHWADEGFVGTNEQRQVLMGHLVKAERLLFEANVYLSRLFEHIPVNLKCRVSDQSVWLPSMLKWLTEKFKADRKQAEAKKTRRTPQPRRQAKGGDSDEHSPSSPS